MAYVLTVAGAGATIVALIARWELCRDGTHKSCLDGQGPAGELVGQLIAAPVSLGLAVLSLVFAARRARRAALACALLALAAGGVWVALLASATG
jgi:hypothetical protein